MYETYHEQGFDLIAFPANQFGGQAPGTSDEEREYAFRKFGFEFDVYDKIAVKDKATPQFPGPEEISPVYAFLKGSGKEFSKEIEWNYVKFLVDADGQVRRRYSPADPLDQGLEKDVKLLLAGKPLPEKQSTYLGAA